MGIQIQLPLFGAAGAVCAQWLFKINLTLKKREKKRKEWVNITISLVGIF